MTKSAHSADTRRTTGAPIRYVLCGVGITLLATAIWWGLRSRQRHAPATAARPTFAQLDAQAELSAPPPAPHADDLAQLRQFREELDRLPSKVGAEELTQAARQARQTGDLWYANRLIHAALQQNPQQRQARLLWANNLYLQTRFDAAQHLYTQLNKEDRKDAAAYIGLADVALVMNRQANVTRLMSRALHESEQSPENLLLLAQKYLDWSQLPEVEQVANYVRRIAPDSVDARLLLASMLLQRGQIEPARQIVEPLLQSAPKNARAHRVLAAILRHPGTHSDAQRVCALFARAIELDPGDTDTLRLAGDYYREQRLYRLSVQSYARLLALEPANPEARYGMAQDYVALGMPEQAAAQTALHKRLREQELQARSLREQISLNPRQPEPHLRLARFLAQQGNVANAVTEYQIAIGLQPTGQPLRHELAQLFQRFGWGAPGNPSY